MRALLTGATGFVGRALTRTLDAEGAEMVLVCRDATRVVAKPGKRVRVVEASLHDVQSLTGAMDGCDVVFHVAALIAYDRRDRAQLFKTNVLGTRAVVEACLTARVPRLVHTSSIAACAHSLDGSVLDETAPWNSEGLRIDYFTTKHLAEREVRAGVERGLDAVIVNPGSIFGAGSGGSTAKTIRDLARRRIPAAPPGGSACIGVNDVAAGHMAAWRRGQRGERYVLTSENLSWMDLLTEAASVLGVRPPAWTLPRGFTSTAAAVLDAASWCGIRQPNLSGPALRALGVHLYFDGRKAATELGLRPAPMRAVLGETVSDLRMRGWIP